MIEKKEQSNMDKIISLCKRRGFVFPGSEIYGGLAGTWDYGHYGSQMAYNIKELWWRHFVREREDMLSVTTPTLMPEAVWRASGHLDGFADPLVECKKCHHRFRADQLEDKKKCPDCGGELDEEKVFNLLLPVALGSVEGRSNLAYLRGEIAQGMFVNFKNIVDTMHPKLPFGIAQIGRAYRNEISPRDFLFRVREFDLMELEYFVRPNEWERYFEMWRKEIWRWIERVGIDKNSVFEKEVPEDERAHYSKRTIDFEFDYPFGRKELYGLAYRTDYDLKNHKLDYYDENSPDGKKVIVPHVVEPTFGHGRTMLAVLLSSYKEEDDRIILSLKPEIAPVKIAVFPLLRNKEGLVKKAKEIYKILREEFYDVEFDDRGNIGKRYYSQDEIGTPYCITIDFKTLEDDTVTIRERDTANQERVEVKNLLKIFKERLGLK